jgi:hypothetical protein
MGNYRQVWKSLVLVAVAATPAWVGLLGSAVANLPVCNRRTVDATTYSDCTVNWLPSFWCGHWRNKYECEMSQGAHAGPAGIAWSWRCTEPGPSPVADCVVDQRACKEKFFCVWNPLGFCQPGYSTAAWIPSPWAHARTCIPAT